MYPEAAVTLWLAWVPPSACRSQTPSPNPFPLPQYVSLPADLTMWRFGSVVTNNQEGCVTLCTQSSCTGSYAAKGASLGMYKCTWSNDKDVFRLVDPGKFKQWAAFPLHSTCLQ